MTCLNLIWCIVCATIWKWIILLLLQTYFVSVSSTFSHSTLDNASTVSILSTKQQKQYVIIIHFQAFWIHYGILCKWWKFVVFFCSKWKFGCYAHQWCCIGLYIYLSMYESLNVFHFPSDFPSMHSCFLCIYFCACVNGANVFPFKHILYTYVYNLRKGIWL